MTIHHLHRITEVDEACAEEGGRCPADENQGRGYCPVHTPLKTVEQEFPWEMGLLYVVGVFAGIGGSYFFARWFQ